MNYNQVVIDFLASCVEQGTFDETEAKKLLCELGKAIDRGIVANHDVSDIQHNHDVLLNLISYNHV